MFRVLRPLCGAIDLIRTGCAVRPGRQDPSHMSAPTAKETHMRMPYVPVAEAMPLPELELPAAEEVLAKVRPLARSGRELVGFIQRIASPARDLLAGEIRICPLQPAEQGYRLGAADSATRPKELSARTILLGVAYRTSATRNEASEVECEELDGSHDVDAVAHIMRDTMEARLLAGAMSGDDQLLILDNSFLSLVENAARSWLAVERCESPMTRDVLARYCAEHLGSDGTFVRLLSNARVIALPKLAEAQSLTKELYAGLGLNAHEQIAPAAAAVRDKVLLRRVLRPGEYLPPRNLLGPPDRSAIAQRERFFHRATFPAREPLLDVYGVGRGEDEPYGLDVVYFRPRRPEGAVDAPVMRVELHRQVARSQPALERVLGTLEVNGDGEHAEPMAQLLADQLAKSSVASILDALIEAQVIELIEETSDAGDDDSLELIRWLHEEARS